MATNVIAFPDILQTKTGRGAVGFDADYLARLRSGDDKVGKHFEDYFRRLLRLKFWGQFKREQGEELATEVMAAVRRKIAQGEPDDPSLLPAYVLGISSDLASIQARHASTNNRQECPVTREQLRAFFLRRTRHARWMPLGCIAQQLHSLPRSNADHTKPQQ